MKDEIVIQRFRLEAAEFLQAKPDLPLAGPSRGFYKDNSELPHHFPKANY